MMDFTLEAGEIALKFWGKSKPSLKADRSILTLADKAISELAHHKLSKLLSSGEHILIDEEDPAIAQYLDKDILNRAKYIWSVDPIDGTRNYANQIPPFAVSIGLMKNLKPWMGVVYFPVLQELFYCDGKKTFFIERFGTKEQKKTLIKSVQKEVNGQTYFLITDHFFKRFDWDHKDCRVMIQSCAVVEMCWPTIGRGCGGLIKSSIWDFAGSWPIVRAAGMDLRSLRKGKRLDHLDINAFDPKIPWRLNDFYVISNEKNYPILRSKIFEKPKII